jgi:hypothetical protein
MKTITTSQFIWDARASMYLSADQYQLRQRLKEPLEIEDSAAFRTRYGTRGDDHGNWVTMETFGLLDVAKVYARREFAVRFLPYLKHVKSHLGADEYARQGWHRYGGCYNDRLKRGGTKASMHAYGLAIDINPAANPFNSTDKSFSMDALLLGHRYGIFNGGLAWGHDYMHFQSVLPHVSKGSFYDKQPFIVPPWFQLANG